MGWGGWVCGGCSGMGDGWWVVAGGGGGGSGMDGSGMGSEEAGGVGVAQW